MMTSVGLAISFALSIFFSDKLIEGSPRLSEFLLVVGVVLFCFFVMSLPIGEMI
jgi:hypothetical protein